MAKRHLKGSNLAGHLVISALKMSITFFTLRDNWHTTLHYFQVHDMVIWCLHKLGNDDHLVNIQKYGTFHTCTCYLAQGPGWSLYCFSVIDVLPKWALVSITSDHYMFEFWKIYHVPISCHLSKKKIVNKKIH